MFIPDPDFFQSQIRIFSIPEPGSRIRIKEFNPKNCFQALGNIRIQDPDFLTIPDPGVKKAPDPASGSAKLLPALSA
jgi:hypothetical protein